MELGIRYLTYSNNFPVINFPAETHAYRYSPAKATAIPENGPEV